MADLSPAAQAIRQINNDMCDQPVLSVIAAALRVAADQVVPHEPQECKQFTNEAVRLNRMGTRSQLFAIATELENGNN